jgi:DNA repair protein RadA/Sms
MAKPKVSYQCRECGSQSASQLGRCPACQSWGSFEEVLAVEAAKPEAYWISGGIESAGSPRKSRGSGHVTPPQLTSLATLLSEDGKASPLERFSTGFTEVDRLLGVGLVPGAYCLIGGEPGIGKSTLMLQLAGTLATEEQPAYYFSGEESDRQIALRAQRLQIPTNRVEVMACNTLEPMLKALESETRQPRVIFVDSAQAIYSQGLDSAPGSQAQLKAVAHRWMDVAKRLQIPVFLVSHVTKEGTLYGPKLMEHLVDVVLSFEGDAYRDLRLLRCFKNRYGPTPELAVFEMREQGLQEISNPSTFFLGAQALNQPEAGCVPFMSCVGERVFTVEVQALVAPTSWPTPRRQVNGLEHSRIHQVVAVLEQHGGMDFSRQDVYLNVTGGLSVEEPAADLAMALALAGSLSGKPLVPHTVVAGELGLTGEIRPVQRLETRLREGLSLGARRFMVPKQLKASVAEVLQQEASGAVRYLEVQHLNDALAQAFVP